MYALWSTRFTIFMLIFMSLVLLAYPVKCPTSKDLNCYNCLHIGIQKVKESHGCEIGKLGEMDLTDKVTYYRIYKDVSDSWSADVVINRSADTKRPCAFCLKEYGTGNSVVSRGKVLEDPSKNGKCEPDPYTPELTKCFCGTNGCNTGNSTRSSVMIIYITLFSMFVFVRKWW